MQACASLSAQPAGERQRRPAARSDTAMVGVPRPEVPRALTHPTAGAVGARSGFRGTAVPAAPRSARPCSRRCKQVGWRLRETPLLLGLSCRLGADTGGGDPLPAGASDGMAAAKCGNVGDCRAPRCCRRAVAAVGGGEAAGASCAWHMVLVGSSAGCSLGACCTRSSL